MLPLRFRLSRLVAADARRAFGNLAMFYGRLPMDVVTTDAGRLALSLQDFAHVLRHVPVARIHGRQVGVGQTDLEVAEQVVSGDEVRRIGKSRAPRLPGSQVA